MDNRATPNSMEVVFYDVEGVAKIYERFNVEAAMRTYFRGKFQVFQMPSQQLKDGQNAQKHQRN